MGVTATLENYTQSGKVYVGEIYGDTRGWFIDGTLIRTSPTQKIEGGFLYTLNSVYRLG